MQSQNEISTVTVENHLLEVVGGSYQGTREYQQDTYYSTITEHGLLAVICDGMGGMEHGEIASLKTVEKLVEDFEKWEGEDPYVFLCNEAVLLDKYIYKLHDDQGQPIRCGTTIVAVLIFGNELHWLSLGDSRIYIIRGTEMECVTRDHNYGLRLNEKYTSGKISYEEYLEESVKAEALISFIGIGGIELMDVNKDSFELMSGDKIFMCSDGIYKCVEEEFFRKVLISNKGNIKELLDSIFDEVIHAPKKNKDNATAIVLAYQ